MSDRVDHEEDSIQESQTFITEVPNENEVSILKEDTIDISLVEVAPVEEAPAPVVDGAGGPD